MGGSDRSVTWLDDDDREDDDREDDDRENDDRENDVNQQDEPAHRRWPPHTNAVAVATLVVGLIVGYLVGWQRSAPVGRALVAPVSPSSVVADAPAETGQHCWQQTDPTHLQLGIEVRNRSGDPLTLTQVTAVLPLGGLSAQTTRRGGCARTVPGPDVTGYVLAPGTSVWLTTTFAALTTCPAALPVHFDLSYLRSGWVQTSQLAGFADLGRLPYVGCVVTPH